MDIKDLQEIGLARNEATIYLLLIEKGPLMAGNISRYTLINRTTVYDTIERLVEKSLVKYTLSANRKVFSAVKPNTLLDQAKERQDKIKEILPELNKIYSSSSKDEQSNIHKGRKGIRSVLNDILNYESYVAFGSSGRFIEIMKHDFEMFQRKKKEKEIKARVILAESSRGTKQVLISHSRFRFIHDKFSAPTTTFVYGYNTATIVWSSVPIATVINSKEVSQSFKGYFELLWKTAEQ